ncbi:MFS transporter [Acidiphilium sp. AL]|uniref:MFS transporter n=1 Tax=Acidiphilium sp. AL TaxID=2871704 RepID=UPI0021CAEBF3|nr:MFS transporter [Acidiphilium sp. AL]MCU4161203.1 MFS transporter [Acidiphilium sp. AL]
MSAYTQEPTIINAPEFRKAKWTITMAASFGWFFDAYVITIYALTIPLIAKTFDVSTTLLAGGLGSIFLIGYTLGTIIFGTCGDIFGRKTMLGVSIIGYGIATALTALATGIVSLAVLRFITGLGGGGELAVGAPFVSEVWDRNHRSSGVGFMYSFYPLGFVFAVIMFHLIAPVWGWRAVYVFSLVPAVVILVLRLRLEESPRFQKVVSQIKEGHSKKTRLIQAVKNPVLRYRILVGFLIFVSLTYGYYAMVFYIPAFVVQKYHLTAATGAAAVTSLLQIAGVIGGLTGGIIGDRIGRRIPAIVAAVLLMGSILLWWGANLSLTGFCIMTVIGGFLIAYEWAVGIVYVTEIFPTEIRASGFGWSAGLARIVSIAAPVMTQVLAGALGVAHAIQVSAVIWLSLIVGYLISHETRGTELADKIGSLVHKQ